MSKHTSENRFWAKVDVRGPDDCWEWKGAKDKQGYGNFWTGQRYQKPHRFVLSLFNIELKDTYFSCHECDNPSCVNPRHLVPGNQKYNMKGCVQRGRHFSPALSCEKHPMAKLNQSDVIAIRKTTGSYTTIGSIFGVSRQTINRIKNMKSWRHLNG